MSCTDAAHAPPDRPTGAPRAASGGAAQAATSSRRTPTSPRARRPSPFFLPRPHPAHRRHARTRRSSQQHRTSHASGRIRRIAREVQGWRPTRRRWDSDPARTRVRSLEGYPPPMAFHRWASDSSAGLSRVRASILRPTAEEAARISRRMVIQVTGGVFLLALPAWSGQHLRYQARVRDGSGSRRAGGPGRRLERTRRRRWASNAHRDRTGLYGPVREPQLNRVIGRGRRLPRPSPSGPVRDGP